MSMTLTQAISRIRNRLRDTTSPYHYSDALISEMLNPALEEIQGRILAVDPAYLLTRVQWTGQTDALDPGTYEFYPLPSDFMEVKWVERADSGSGYFPKLRQFSPADLENNRYAGYPWIGSTYTDPVSGTTYADQGSALEAFAIYGKDRARILPAPVAVTQLYACWYIRQLTLPTGSAEVIELPRHCEEAVVLSVAIRLMRLDGESTANGLADQLYGTPREEGELKRAVEMCRKRSNAPVVMSRPYTGG